MHSSRSAKRQSRLGEVGRGRHELAKPLARQEPEEPEGEADERKGSEAEQTRGTISIIVCLPDRYGGLLTARSLGIALGGWLAALSAFFAPPMAPNWEP